MQTTLSDGSHAQGVHLTSPPVYGGACALMGNVWVLNKGSSSVTIRNARTGEIVSKVDLLDEGVAICAVGSRVWVSTTANKLFFFNHEFSLLGAIPTAMNPVKRFYCLDEHTLFTSGDGKDFVKWDTSQFAVERTFFGRVAGEVVTDIAPANLAAGTFIASTTKAIRLWSFDGTCLAEVGEGALAVTNCLAVDGKETVWAAQANWITVFSLSSTTSSNQFSREKTLPSPNIGQLIRTSPEHVASIDRDGLITVWAVKTMTPQRTFKTIPPTALDLRGGQSTIFTLRALQTSTTVLWTLHDSRALIWADEYVNADSASKNAVEGGDPAQELKSDEVQYLRRKLKYLEALGTMYRQKAGMLFRDQSHQDLQAGGAARAGATQRIAAFNDLDKEYAKALSTWSSDPSNQEPLPDISIADLAPGAAGANGDFTEYWKQKYKDAVTELEKLRADNEGMLAMMHTTKLSDADSDSGSGILVTGSVAKDKELDVKRAHHICQIIKEKNDLKEHVRQLTDDVQRLRSKLREFNSPLASKGPIEEDIHAVRQTNEELRAELTRLKAKIDADAAVLAENQAAMKHNQILKQRVKKLRTDLDNLHIQMSEQTAAAQNDVQSLLESLAVAQAELEEQKKTAGNAAVAQAAAELAVTQKQAIVDRYQAIAEAAERELNQRDAVEKAAQSQVRNEIEMLCQSLDDRDKRLTDLLEKFNAASAQLRERTLEAAEAKAVLEAKTAELEAQQQRIEQLEEIVLDRKNFGRAMGELQGRMEMMVEELRRSFTPVQFAENIDNLENRVAALYSLEGQLKQKDDIIAFKDDEILRLKEHLERINEQVTKVSSVFLHLPKSVEEVELLMVEVDEYRRRLGLDPETQEMIQIRLLELQAKRKAGAKAMDDLIPKSKDGKSAVELQRLKELAATLQSVASAAAHEDKTGLVGSPVPSGAVRTHSDPVAAADEPLAAI
jgi:hypothetical protein